MCSGQEWTPEARAVVTGAKRRLREIQQLQVASVCLGIEHLHLVSKRRRATAGAGGAARVSPPPGQQPRPCHDSGDTARDPRPTHHHHPHRASSCRLCYSTLRVLSIARAHGKRCRLQQQHRHQNHMGDNDKRAAPSRVLSCEACRMWSMVGDRCASLGIPLPGDMFVSAVGGGHLSDNGVAATAAATATALAALPDTGPVVRVDTVANE